MGVYKTLVCHTCKTNYEAWKSHSYADEEAKNHEGHNIEFAYDGEIQGEYFDYETNEFHFAIDKPGDYKEIDLLEIND